MKNTIEKVSNIIQTAKPTKKSFIENDIEVTVIVKDVEKNELIVTDEHEKTIYNFLNGAFHKPVNNIDDVIERYNLITGIPLWAFVGKTQNDTINSLSIKDSGGFGKIAEYLLLGNIPNSKADRDHKDFEMKSHITNNHRIIGDIELCSFDSVSSHEIDWYDSTAFKKLEKGILIVGAETNCAPINRTVTSLSMLKTDIDFLINNFRSDYKHIGTQNHYLRKGTKNSGDTSTLIIPDWIAHNPQWLEKII